MPAEHDDRNRAAPAGGPPPRKRGPDEWLPPLPDISAQPPRMTLWRRATRRIRPVHQWLGSLGSALLGGLVVLAVMLYVGQRAGWFVARSDSPPAAPADPAAIAPPALVSPSPAGEGRRRTAGSGAAAAPAHPRADEDAPRHERPASARAAAVAALTKEDIISIIRQNAPSLGSCIEAARKRETVVAGPTKLLVDFVVSPNGAVKAVEVKGPDWLQRTSVPKCVGSRIRAWQFPASQAGAPIKNLPLPVTF
jgi:hypothetical protein